MGPILSNPQRKLGVVDYGEKVMGINDLDWRLVLVALGDVGPAATVEIKAQ